jgi:signal transduction histidine kinase
MKVHGQVLERETGIHGDRNVPTSGERPASAVCGRGECFAGYVAHELRAPIALQRALIEVALADPRADAAALRETGERVLASCLAAQCLIDALLELARGARTLLRREPVDLAAIVATALQAHELGGLRSVVALEPVWTTGDRDLLERLAANLVSNAIRHNIAGGRIAVATGAHAGRVVLCVANTGPRVPASELHRLFQPFQRLTADRAENVDALGLGLAIVHAIADAHDARVTAQPQPAGGLEIRVDFEPLDIPARPPRDRRAGRADDASASDQDRFCNKAERHRALCRWVPGPPE